MSDTIPQERSATATDPASCPAWCELDGAAEHIAAYGDTATHVSSECVGLLSTAFTVRGEQFTSSVIVSLRREPGDEVPHFVLSTPADDGTDNMVTMTLAEAADLAEALRGLLAQAADVTT
jgi:hypothetical protein